MEPVDIEYAEDTALETLLHAIDRQGDFCTHGKLFAPMPRLEIDGVGMLSFPVPEGQARALIAAAERAPYGKGTETLVDTSVRDCWQIDSTRIRLAGGAWPETFAKILDAAAAGLGCPGERLEARLYKLLVYERGGFFSAHRDTEKAEGMIATLSISLPAAGDGGDLIVRHDGREIVADMHAEEPSELAFAAFYADCSHEVRPVVEGRRLALVFNLCLRPDDEATPRKAPDYTEQIDGIAERLAAWQRDDDATEKLVWLLEHEYSEAGLSFATLKNADAARAQALAAAAERADCEIHAAIVHIEEHGYAIYEGGGYGRDWEVGPEDMTMGEVDESDQWLDDWADRNGGRPPLGEVKLMPGEALPEGALDDAVPDEQHVHEATGNAGASLERAYHYAALVLWPRSKTLSVIAGGSIGGAIAWVAAELDRDGGAAGARIRELASGIVGLWPERDRDDKENRARMFDLLSAVGDGECVARFLHEVVLPRYGGENEKLPAALRTIGPEAAKRFLFELIDAHFTRQPGGILGLLRRLGEEGDESAGPAREDGAWAEMLREGVRSALVTMSDVPAAPEETLRARPLSGWPVDRWPAPAALGEFHEEGGPTDTTAFATLWRHAAAFLLSRSAAAPEEPSDWKIPADLDRTDDLLKDLQAFCDDPAAEVMRFRVRRDLRSHVRGAINRHELDIDYETERRRSPHTLICTKNRASHRRRLAEYAEDVSCMRRLILAAPTGAKAAPCAPDLVRLQEAVAATGAE